MTKYLILAILPILAGYGLFEAWPLIAGPALSVASPLNNTPFPGGIVTVRGKVARAAQLTLDGAPVLHEEDGTFLVTLTFPHGGSVLTFAASDRFGRRATATRTIFVP
ncbi:MAG: hypothetical protein ABSB00_02535 [Minisyncoccia bacterium]|jgi:hypothetical protein